MKTDEELRERLKYVGPSGRRNLLFILNQRSKCREGQHRFRAGKCASCGKVVA